MRDAVLAVSGRLDRRLGGPPTPLVSRADGLVLVSADGSGRGRIGAASISSPGGITRSACSTFLISRSWRSTARGGRPRRRRFSRWRRSTANSCRTRPSRSPRACGPRSGLAPIMPPGSNGPSCWRFGDGPSPAESRLCVALSRDDRPSAYRGAESIARAGRRSGPRGSVPHAALRERVSLHRVSSTNWPSAGREVRPMNPLSFPMSRRELLRAVRPGLRQPGASRRFWASRRPRAASAQLRRTSRRGRATSRLGPGPSSSS